MGVYELNVRPIHRRGGQLYHQVKEHHLACFGFGFITRGLRWSNACAWYALSIFLNFMSAFFHGALSARSQATRQPFALCDSSMRISCGRVAPSSFDMCLTGDSHLLRCAIAVCVFL